VIYIYIYSNGFKEKGNTKVMFYFPYCIENSVVIRLYIYACNTILEIICCKIN